MPITVDYTPVGAVYEAARYAGSVSGQLQAFQLRQQREMFDIRMQADEESRRWQEQMRQEAATEDYQRTLAMAQAKSQIDFDSDVAMYQRKRQMLTAEIDQIQGADFLTQPQKDEIAKKAYAKHFGVTLGSTTMENFLAKQQYKMAMVTQLQEQVDANADDPTTGMSPEEARNYAAGAGIPYSANMFVPEREVIREKRDALGSDFRSTVAAMDDFKEDNKGRVFIFDREKRRWKRATSQQEGIYERLKQEAEYLSGELGDLERMSAAPVPQKEIDAYLAKLGPDASVGWELAKAEGVSFQQFLVDNKLVPKRPREPSLLEKISPVGALSYIVRNR